MPAEAGPPRTPHPRLHPARHHQPVRRLRPGHRLSVHPALPRARHQKFLRFLKLIDTVVPKDLDLHLVHDYYATRKTPAIKDRLIRHPGFHLHFTPTNSSWLNMAERWFAELTNRKIRQRSPLNANGSSTQATSF
jgi:transposase